MVFSRWRRKNEASGPAKRRQPSTGLRAPVKPGLLVLEERVAPAVYVWKPQVGLITHNWSTAANWQVNGQTATTPPGANDDVVFNSTGGTGNSTIDTAFGGKVKGITLDTGFQGGLTDALSTAAAAGDLTVGVDGFVIKTAGMSFFSATHGQPVNFVINVAGNWSLSGGTFTAGDSSLLVTVNLTGSGSITGGTFNPGNSVFNFNAATGVQTLDMGGQSFYGVTHSGAGTLQLVNHALSAGGQLTNSAGTLDANGQAAAVTGLTSVTGGTYQGSTAGQTLAGGLSMTGGTLTTATTGLVTLGGDVTATSDAGGHAAAVRGNLSLGGSGRTFTVTRGAGAQDLVISGVVSGAAGVGLTEAGTGILALSGANTYSGATTVSTGTLLAGAANTLPAGTGLTVAQGATFDLAGYNQTVASLAGAGKMTLGSATLTTGDGTSPTFSGVVSGTGGLVKQGSGTFTLSGANTYSGPTMVSAGTLLVLGSQPNSSVTVGAGATLGGTGTVGAITVAGGTLSPGTTNPGTLTASGNVVFAPGSVFNVALNGTTAGSGYSQLVVAPGNSVANLGGSTLSTTLGFTSAIGDSFKLIDNQGAAGVTGTFANTFPITAGGVSFGIN
jgi:autotransporter-associated beta strand protein